MVNAYPARVKNVAFTIKVRDLSSRPQLTMPSKSWRCTLTPIDPRIANAYLPYVGDLASATQLRSISRQ